jgi:hypothetical protein
MNVWFRGAALASGLLMLAGIHVGAHKREVGRDKQAPRGRPTLAARPNHPVVLLNGRIGESVEGERIVEQILLKQLDPKTAVDRVSPPMGVDGIIAYPAAGTLMVRGTKEAVASFRASLEKLDRESGEPAAPAAQPVITIGADTKLSLKADRVETEGSVVRATGHVVIGLPNGIELRADQVRVTTEGGKKRIVIEK